MAAPFIIPFNFQPTSTNRGTTATYTVPAGKYAKITVLMDHDFELAATVTSPQNSIPTTSQSKSIRSKNIETWLSSGSTLVVATTNTNGSATRSNNNTFEAANATGTIATTVTINGVAWITITSKGNITICGYNATGSYGVTATCFSSSGWIAEEYNIIS